jgi:preprotein translocase subunit YajC
MLILIVIVCLYICIMFGIVLFSINRFQKKCRKYIEDVKRDIEKEQF